MNRYKTLLLSLALCFCVVATAQNQTETKTPTRIRIGETIITLQSPLQVEPTGRDTVDMDVNLSISTSKRSYSRSYPRRTEEFHFGFGFSVPLRNADFLPIHYGNSFNIEFGTQHLYYPSKHYGIGLFWQYSCYSYRMKETLTLFTGNPYPTDNNKITREFFRTSNLGTGIVQRLRLSRNTQLEAIAYGDWAFSKRYVVKSSVDGKKVKDKYRDGTKFNPFGGGVQAGIRCGNTTLYARYRLTNFFNPDIITPEVPRLSIGVSFGL
ncbi:MAG: hypothetical protein LBC84_04220 [Prevotellaceae bacterium]|jgi:hypothetical protein|nr:hypothetical protein [Prevotellaceae bacterium]